jgi:hypothetical protein
VGPEGPDFNKCDRCLGKVSDKVPEPRTADGRDYVMQPMDETFFARVRRNIPSVFNRNQTKETSTDPFFLLRQGPVQCPVSWLIDYKRMGLNHFLSQGVTIDDFLDNGYTWDDLKKFEAFGEPGKGVQALFALRTTADHFRQYPHALPVATLRQEIGLKSGDLCEYFGLHFPPAGPLTSPKSNDWTAEDCVALGLKMEDLMEFGMQYVEQYRDLQPTAAIEAQLEPTDAHVNELELLDAPTPVAVAAPTPVPVAAPAPVRRRPPVIEPQQRVLRKDRHGLRPSAIVRKYY